MASDIAHQQDPLSVLGKVLRINRDGTIPSDNPYPNSPVYNIGHRNMFGIAFNNNGFGLVTENGASLYDEINSVEKAGNYGFPTLQPPDQAPELSNSSLSIKPLRSYRSVIGPTGAIYYDGEKIPELKNKFLFGTVTGNIFGLKIDNDSKEIREDRILLKVYEDVIALAQSPSGQIYYGGFGIYELKTVDVSSKRKVLFSIEASFPSWIYNVKYFTLFTAEKKLLMITDPRNNTFRQHSKDIVFDYPPITVRIPRELMNEISSVSVFDAFQKKEWNLTRGSNFTVDSSALDHTAVIKVIPGIIASGMQQQKKMQMTRPDLR